MKKDDTEADQLDRMLEMTKHASKKRRVEKKKKNYLNPSMKLPLYKSGENFYHIRNVVGGFALGFVLFLVLLGRTVLFPSHMINTPDTHTDTDMHNKCSQPL